MWGPGCESAAQADCLCQPSRHPGGRGTPGNDGLSRSAANDSRAGGLKKQAGLPEEVRSEPRGMEQGAHQTAPRIPTSVPGGKLSTNLGYHLSEKRSATGLSHRHVAVAAHVALTTHRTKQAFGLDDAHTLYMRGGGQAWTPPKQCRLKGRWEHGNSRGSGETTQRESTRGTVSFRTATQEEVRPTLSHAGRELGAGRLSAGQDRTRGEEEWAEGGARPSAADVHSPG